MCLSLPFPSPAVAALQIRQSTSGGRRTCHRSTAAQRCSIDTASAIAAAQQQYNMCIIFKTISRKTDIFITKIYKHYHH